MIQSRRLFYPGKAEEAAVADLKPVRWQVSSRSSCSRWHAQLLAGAAGKMSKGESRFDKGFTMKEAMSALELMDPKTDPGLYLVAMRSAEDRVRTGAQAPVPQTLRKRAYDSYAFSLSAGAVRAPDSLSELLCILDQLTCQQALFFSGLMASHTLYTCALAHPAGLRMLHGAAAPVVRVLEAAGLPVLRFDSKAAEEPPAATGDGGADEAGIAVTGGVTVESVLAFVAFAHVAGTIHASESVRRMVVASDIYAVRLAYPLLGEPRVLIDPPRPSHTHTRTPDPGGGLLPGRPRPGHGRGRERVGHERVPQGRTVHHQGAPAAGRRKRCGGCWQHGRTGGVGC